MLDWLLIQDVRDCQWVKWAGQAKKGILTVAITTVVAIKVID
jgi:hypothetical protein